MIVLQNMGGIAPKVTSELLPENLAQTASNLLLHKGGVAPLKNPTTVSTPTKSGTKKTIYRYGISQPESQYWFSWTTQVNVCRGPIAGDTTERTYFTGDGVPKKTDFSLALSGGTSYPVAAYEMGVPAPDTAALVVADPAATVQSNDTLRGALSQDTEYLSRSTTRFPFQVRFYVFRGTTDETSLWTVTYKVSLTSKVKDLTVTATDSSNTIVNVTASPNKKGTITFTAKRDGYPDVTAVFTYVASADVASNTVYRVVKSSLTLLRGLDSSYTPAQLDLTSQKSTSTVDGTRVWVDDARWFVIYEMKAGVYTKVYSSTAAEINKAFTPRVTAESVRVDLCLANAAGTEPDTTKVVHRAIFPVASYVVRSGELQEDRAYVYTNVTAWGEESAPSPAAVGTRYPGTVLRLTSFDAPPDGAYNIEKRYIYRTVTSSAGTNYYWVGEVLASASEFVDTTDVAAIGEPLVTLDWDTPPDTLSGLIALPSGALCGFSGKQVCFSVIGAPYAWPQKYRLTCDYDIVAVAPMGQGVAVLTTGFPYFINTGDPEAAQMIRTDEEQACVSARSAVPFQGGVIYASPDGLVLFSQQGAKLLTEAMYDHETWQTLNPTTIFAAKHDNRYYAFFDGGGGLILDATGNLSTHDIAATAAYVDPVLDQMYVAVGTNIQKWYAGSAKTTTWKSKRFNLPTPTNFSCFQVKANTYANLTFKLYVDGVLAYSVAVAGPSPQRLPSGFLARGYEFEITGVDHWTLCAIANSMTELKNV